MSWSPEIPVIPGYSWCPKQNLTSLIVARGHHMHEFMFFDHWFRLKENCPTRTSEISEAKHMRQLALFAHSPCPSTNCEWGQAHIYLWPMMVFSVVLCCSGALFLPATRSRKVSAAACAFFCPSPVACWNCTVLLLLDTCLTLWKEVCVSTKFPSKNYNHRLFTKSQSPLW